MLYLSQSIEKHLRKALKNVFAQSLLNGKISESQLAPHLVRASKKEFGDFQANFALSLAKYLNQSPREVASSIVNELVQNSQFLEFCETPKIAGPGFINFTIRKESIESEIQKLINNNLLTLQISNNKKLKKELTKVIIDFSSPNIAKEMHVGHLRSTIIGDSLARIFEFQGYTVLRLNHVGDWGTQFGMLINHLKQVAPEALQSDNGFNCGDLVVFYRQAKERFDNEESFRNESRDEVVRLQRGESDSLKAWQLLCNKSRNEFETIYKRLKIRIEERGESFYNQYLGDVIYDLEKLGLLVEDQGAKCVFLENFIGKDGSPLPLIVQKSDGGFNYATTDLASIRYRFAQQPEGDGAARIIYVTDAGQANHFAGVFEVAKRANWVPEDAQIEHVPFGLVQGEDGKKLKTRSGKTIRLRDLLDEAVHRAEVDLRSRLDQEDRSESESFIKHVSTVVGLGAVKYADLSQNRNTSYQFSFNRMLSLQGNTAPYLLYSLVRIAGIARKGGQLTGGINELHLNETYELDLAREILKFDEVVVEVTKELLPNRLCTYLFELSQVFNRFYDQLPILKASEPLRTYRLALCSATADTLKLGLGLLGIDSLERM